MTVLEIIFLIVGLAILTFASLIIYFIWTMFKIIIEFLVTVGQKN